MENFFSTFDDGLFTEETKKDVGHQIFVSEFKEEQWFLKENHNSDSNGVTDTLTLTKHRADYYYLNKHYRDAIKLYKKMLMNLPENNIVTTRECHENIARCSFKEGLYCSSLLHSNLLHQSSKTIEHLTVSLSCLLDSLLHSCRYKEACLCCMRLLTIHKYSSFLWLRLAMIFCKLFSFNNFLETNKKFFHLEGKSLKCQCSVDNCAVMADEEKDEYLSIVMELDMSTKNLYVLFSLMMARDILVSTRGTSVGIALADIDNKLICVEADISSFSLRIPESSSSMLKNLVRKFVFGRSLDLNEEAEEFVDRGSSKFKNEQSEDVTPSTVMEMNCRSFCSVWFSKI